MPYTVAIRSTDENGELSQPFYPDILTTFDFPIEAKAYLLALVADEIDAATQTTCSWLSDDVLEVRQPNRQTSRRHRQFIITPVAAEK
jgi:hypothetical protein